jgi:GxxExxY protein
MQKTMTQNHVVYKDLSYKICGILLKVHNELGPYCSEKQYGDKIEYHFKLENIPYEREVVIPISFEGERPGRNKTDFIVANKIVLEIKTVRMLDPECYYQVQRYLKAINKKLGILVNFRDRYLKPKRILNSAAKEED